MGKRLNIGIFIGKNDADIAIWLNMMRDNKMSGVSWIRGLLAAYALGQHLPIGTINLNTPLVAPIKTGEDILFGTDLSYSERMKTDKRGSGWQIRGPNREIIHGTVYNVPLDKNSFTEVLSESWENGRHLSTFIKGLIRQNLMYGGKNIPPRQSDLTKMLSAYAVNQNSVPRKELPPRKIKEAHPANSDKRQLPNPPVASDAAIHVKEEAPAQAGKNPLLAEI